MPNWAGLTAVCGITAVEKAIGHRIAHSVTLVPNVVEDHSKATRFEWLTHPNHGLRKESMMMKKAREKQRRKTRKCSLTGSSKQGNVPLFLDQNFESSAGLKRVSKQSYLI
jgi:hypothetical protein